MEFENEPAYQPWVDQHDKLASHWFTETQIKFKKSSGKQIG